MMIQHTTLRWDEANYCSSSALVSAKYGGSASACSRRPSAGYFGGIKMTNSLKNGVLAALWCGC